MISSKEEVMIFSSYLTILCLLLLWLSVLIPDTEIRISRKPRRKRKQQLLNRSSHKYKRVKFLKNDNFHSRIKEAIR
jgi:hypothetical protein